MNDTFVVDPPAVPPPARVSKIEVAEAMYRAAVAAQPAKMPECLDEVGARTQERYLMLAEAAIEITGLPAPAEGSEAGPSVTELREWADLATVLVEALAWKLNHPQEFAETARSALARYAEMVGESAVSDEVQKAMRI